jgi:hypothetical protein
MWRRMMATTRDAPSAIAIAREVSRVTQLVECNQMLEEVQKGLAAYLVGAHVTKCRRLGTPRSA